MDRLRGDDLRSIAVMGSGHPRVKELRRELRRRGRLSPRVMLEGPRLISEALEAGVMVRTVIVPESAVDRDPVVSLGARLGAEVEILVVRDRFYEGLAATVTPQPMLALVDRPAGQLPERLRSDDVVLVLVDVSDPGNLGTLVRVAESVAARCVVVAGGADPWGDKAVRASAGSVLRVPVVAADDVAGVITGLRDAGATVVGTDVRRGAAYDGGILAPPVALVLGSEAHGLPRDLTGLVDHLVHIPMAGRIDSLNVAMAGTLLAFEARRDRDPPAHATRSDSSG